MTFKMQTAEISFSVFVQIQIKLSLQFINQVTPLYISECLEAEPGLCRELTENVTLSSGVYTVHRYCLGNDR